MKRFFAITLFLTLSFLGHSQIFHFNSTMTTLVKTTDQSPAHWYLEIFNDAGVDTTLRWKASFSNIPAQWNINFDDQDNYHATVNDGDSADFTLFDGLAFPQKLIIGAEFNGVPGTGSIYFDIYDPANPSFIVTIEYRYIVSAVGLDQLESDDLIVKNGSELMFDESLIGGVLEVYSQTGTILTTIEIAEKFSLAELTGDGFVFIVARKQNTVIVKRELLLN